MVMECKCNVNLYSGLS